MTVMLCILWGDTAQSAYHGKSNDIDSSKKSKTIVTYVLIENNKTSNE